MLTTAFVLSALYMLSLATPFSQEKQHIVVPLTKRNAIAPNGVVDVAFLKNQMTGVSNKYQRGLRAFAQNTGKEHPLSRLFNNGSDAGVYPGHSGVYTDANEQTTGKRATDGSVPLAYEKTPNDEPFWQGTITVGTPPQTLTVQFDTGSSDMIFPGAACTSRYCSGHAKYLTASSSTAVDRKRKFGDLDIDGIMEGEEFTDTVSIGGYTVIDQTVGAASVFSGQFGKAHFPPDGIVGMAYQSISKFHSPPLFQTMLSQKQITTPVLSFKLSKYDAEFRLGGVNQALYTEPFSYASVTAEGFWEVELDSIIIATGSSETVVPRKNLRAVIDTGTTIIVAPESEAASFYRVLGGKKSTGPGFYTFPCEMKLTVSLKFGGTPFPISEDTFSLGQVSEGSTDCIGGVIGSDSVPFWVVGDIFLQNVYTTFNLGNNSVGFAKLK